MSQTWKPEHFRLSVTEGIAEVTLDRPDKKNPLTFESYAELRDFFRSLHHQADDVHAVIITGAGGNFCSGGDVFEIIEPLTKMDMKGLLTFTRMTGDLVKAIQGCPQPVIAAVEGVCVGAGAIIAMASDLRYASATAKTAFLFTRVGLAGCDMGACAILPRIIGQGRAADLLYSGRVMTAEEGAAWGFFNAVDLDGAAMRGRAFNVARNLAKGPRFAHMMTKTMLRQEWAMSIEAAVEAEAQAQAICMQTEDFRIAFEAFAAKRSPEFAGR